MKLVLSGTQEDLVNELREIADVIERDGAAEARFDPNSVRSDDSLEIVFESDMDYEGSVLYSVKEAPRDAALV